MRATAVINHPAWLTLSFKWHCMNFIFVWKKIRFESIDHRLYFCFICVGSLNDTAVKIQQCVAGKIFNLVFLPNLNINGTCCARNYNVNTRFGVLLRINSEITSSSSSPSRWFMRCNFSTKGTPRSFNGRFHGVSIY